MPTQSLVERIREARARLDLHIDGNLADFLGVSRRTVQRHAAYGGLPIGLGREKLVRALYPLDPSLALSLARSFGVNLTDLASPAKSTSPARPSAAAGPPEVGREHLALMVLTACDALNLPPRDVRPALAAIFRQAIDLGVDLKQLAALLAGDKPQRAAKA